MDAEVPHTLYLLAEEGSVDIIAVRIDHQQDEQHETNSLDRGHRLIAKRLATDHLDDDEEDVPPSKCGDEAGYSSPQG